jgi:hypothetical protein
MDILKTVLGTTAPWLAAAIGGPLGSLALKSIGNILGLENTTTDTITAALKGVTPEQELALKQADQDFAYKMQALGFAQVKDLAAIDASDRANARERELGVKDHTNRNLAYFFTTGYFATIAVVLYNGIPDGSKEVVFTLIGMLSSILVSVISYYFGSSSGSEKKTELLAEKAFQGID